MAPRPLFTAILCDLDGTLVDTHRDIVAAFQEACRRVTGAPPPAAVAIARHIGKPLREMAAALGYALSPEQWELFTATYRCAHARRGNRAAHPYPGVRATLGALAPVAFAVVTTKHTADAITVLQQLRLEPFFRHVQGWEPGLRLKPAPDTVYAALAALRCSPEQALIVGDTAADVLAGKAAGISTCAVTYGFGSLEELHRAQPDFWIASFRALVPLVHGQGS